MQRHGIVAALAGVSALVLAGAYLTDLVRGTFPTVWSAVLSFSGVAILIGLPVAGAVLVARRRRAGVALLVTLALVAVPAVVTGVHFLRLGGDDGRGSLVTVAVLVGHLAVVAAGASAWTLREPADWRWDRPVRVGYVVLAVGAMVPDVIVQLQSSGWSFSVERIIVGDLLALAQVGTLVVAVGLLFLAARLPRPVAGVVLLALLLPRLHQSVLPLAWTSTQPGMALSALDWMGLCAEVALIATALWWLGRERPTTATDVSTTPAAPSVS